MAAHHRSVFSGIIKMKQIDIGRGLKLPLSAVTQVLAFMGKRGAGKTYAAGKFVEGLVGARAQVVVVDPVGNWWGLRLAADGKAPGLSIPVFGGARGDLPLEPSSGAVVARAVVERGLSAVLDVSHLRKAGRQRFVTDFAEELFHLKKTDRSALHIVLEEAHVFVPQRTHAGQERMLGALEDVIKLGRNYGIGASLLDQRPQAVHKDVLNQTECLLAFQLMGFHERKAIEQWVEDKGVGKGDVAKLSELAVGTALVWSPQWLGFFGRVKIGRKRTFDASATPTVGRAERRAGALADVDLDELRVAMAATVAKAEADDPKALRRRIGELERELADSKARRVGRYLHHATTNGCV